MKRKLASSVFYLLASLLSTTTSSASEFCDLRPPASAAEHATVESLKAAELKKNGFLRVCEAQLRHFDIAFHGTDTHKAGLDFPPIDLEATPFTRLASLGAASEAVGGKRSILYRGFRTPDGHSITLLEHDMSADGSSHWRDPLDEPDRVNGLPARLVVLEAPSGKAVSHLSWVEKRRVYELWINVNVARQPLRAWLFALASSLPLSSPGCPKEKPPRPFRIGENGLPISEPTPTVMTQAEMEERFPKVRPCK